jgi:hypothetical protein
MGCKASAQKNKHDQTYYEDISELRLQYKSQTIETASTKEQVVNGDIGTVEDDSLRLANKMDSLSIYLKSNPMKYSGYRILLYSGQSSEEANKIKKQVYMMNSDDNVYTEYKQPSFRVKVGNYINRIEANYHLEAYKKTFPNAMILPDQIVVE